MTEENWRNDFAKSLAVYMNGRALHATGWKGEQLQDDSFYIIFNAYHGHLEYRLPGEKYGKEWIKLLDTSETEGIVEGGRVYGPGDLLDVEGLSVVLLRQPGQI